MEIKIDFLNWWLRKTVPSKKNMEVPKIILFKKFMILSKCIIFEFGVIDIDGGV